MRNEHNTIASPNPEATARSVAVASASPGVAQVRGHDLARTGILPQLCISPAQMHSMIADAAYYRALQRDFAAGHQLEDWLAAEQEVMANLL